MRLLASVSCSLPRLPRILVDVLLVARGAVFAGTDRIQAYGLREGGPSKAAMDDGKATNTQRCALCHEQTDGRVPPREMIALRSQLYIVDALTQGAMRVHAAGLNAAQIDVLANNLKATTP